MEALQRPKFQYFWVVFLCLISIILCQRSLGNEEAAKFFKPEIRLIEPEVRKGTPTSTVNIPQCGGVTRGYSNFITTPKSQGSIKWYTEHAAKDGWCRLRISEGFDDEEEAYFVIPVSSMTDEGWFKCGTYANRFELKTIRFPDFECDLCTLQLQFRTDEGIIYQCSDITIAAGEGIGWEGMCLNGGAWVNGKCLWASGYKGKYWDGAGYLEGNTPSLWFILFIIIMIIAFMVIFALCVLRFINRQEKIYQKTSPENSDGPDYFGDTIFGDNRTSEVQERRSAFQHQKFEDEE
jgi:hypothetical protein